MKRLPTGIENFEEIRSENFYYVDKTMLIRSLFLEEGKVTLFTRPRRFGKTLNMSMLKYFFEIGRDGNLFDGLKISEDKEFTDNYMNRYPVISISLKEVDGLNFTQAFYGFCNIIYYEAERFYFLKDSDKLTDIDKEKYNAILELGRPSVKLNDETLRILTDSLFNLTLLLRKHYSRKVIILIDEYDVPLDRAHTNHFYDETVNLIRKMFHAALKTNDNLAFGVLTGCLRVSKESIFTGMNNLTVNSITNDGINEYFGFTDGEVDEMLEYYGLGGKKSEIKEWYDGYKFGESEIYCPWDVINYCKDIKSGARTKAVSYWANSSSNSLVRDFVKIAAGQTKETLERLISGEHINKKIREELTYRDINEDIDNLWSVLYMTGYLTGKGEGGNFNLWIPNKEVGQIFEDNIIGWFSDYVKQEKKLSEKFYYGAFHEKADEMADALNEILYESVSLRDIQSRKYLRENFYHALILGLLANYRGIDSNSESGDGYSDITMTDTGKKTAVILELKYSEADDDKALDKACLEALNQIEEKDYERKFKAAGLFNKVIKYGLAFNKKRAMVMIKNESTIN
ncbi:MAG: AAA family ATPase [Catonella sp.]|nr:AAA family ATPase [Catonella sp.]